MDRPPLVLKFIRRRMDGHTCALRGEGADCLVWDYQVALEGAEQPVCADCIEYHAPI